jgi:hypothetical protein
MSSPQLSPSFPLVRQWVQYTVGSPKIKTKAFSSFLISSLFVLLRSSRPTLFLSHALPRLASLHHKAPGPLCGRPHLDGVVNAAGGEERIPLVPVRTRHKVRVRLSCRRVVSCRVVSHGEKMHPTRADWQSGGTTHLVYRFDAPPLHQVPDHDGLVVRHGDQELPVGVEQHGAHPVVVPHLPRLQSPNAGAAGQVCVLVERRSASAREERKRKRERGGGGKSEGAVRGS